MKSLVVAVALIGALVAPPAQAQVRGGTSPTAAEVKRLRAENDSLRKVIDALRASTATPARTLPTSGELLVTPLGGQSGTIEETYDEFTRTTKGTLGGITISPQGWELSLFYSMPGHKTAPPGDVSMMITIHGTNWQYLQCHFLRLLADGTPMALSDEKHDGTVGSGYVLEFIVQHFSVRQFAMMANAKQVRGKLCNDEFEFSPKDLAAMKDFAGRMKVGAR